MEEGCGGVRRIENIVEDEGRMERTSDNDEG